MHDNEFYVGYLPMPSRLKRIIALIISILVAISILTGVLIAASQKKLKGGVFEYGKTTELNGTFHHIPVPALRVEIAQGQYIMIPLVGYGKHGADDAVQEYEKEHHSNLDGKSVSVKGSLIYRGRRTILEVEHDTYIKENSSVAVASLLKTALGDTVLQGQIIDPKCYFGVMNPGEGKPHRECAIRCISGGIPPMFMVRYTNGREEFYILRGKDGEDISKNILDYVADAAFVKGRVYSIDDWKILEMTSIERVRDRE